MSFGTLERRASRRESGVTLLLVAAERRSRKDGAEFVCRGKERPSVCANDANSEQLAFVELPLPLVHKPWESEIFQNDWRNRMIVKIPKKDIPLGVVLECEDNENNPGGLQNTSSNIDR